MSRSPLSYLQKSIVSQSSQSQSNPKTVNNSNCSLLSHGSIKSSSSPKPPHKLSSHSFRSTCTPNNPLQIPSVNSTSWNYKMTNSNFKLINSNTNISSTLTLLNSSLPSKISSPLLIKPTLNLITPMIHKNNCSSWAVSTIASQSPNS